MTRYDESEIVQLIENKLVPILAQLKQVNESLAEQPPTTGQPANVTTEDPGDLAARFKAGLEF